jgi:predicted transcriptional regulator
VAAVFRLLTPDNRRLLALIRDPNPVSVAELVAATGRAQPNLIRTLAKLEAAGLITMRPSGAARRPASR